MIALREQSRRTHSSVRRRGSELRVSWQIREPAVVAQASARRVDPRPDESGLSRHEYLMPHSFWQLRGAAPLICAGRPVPIFYPRRTEPAWGPAADQGVRPTICAAVRKDRHECLRHESGSPVFLGPSLLRMQPNDEIRRCSSDLQGGLTPKPAFSAADLAELKTACRPASLPSSFAPIPRIFHQAIAMPWPNWFARRAFWTTFSWISSGPEATRCWPN